MPIYEFEGKRPTVHPTAWVAPSADIVGSVEIGPHCYVGWRVVLRGDHGRISIGEGSAVEEGVLVHTSLGAETILGRDVTVGHGAVLHGALVDDFAVIGMAATVSNQARVGRWAIVGEMGLVVAGQEVPPESIALGHPVQVVKRLEARHKERWLAGKRRYRQFVSRNRSGLKQIDLDQA